MKKSFFIFFFLLGFLCRAENPPSIVFKENKGQWPDKVLFGSEFKNTQFYINKTGFNYCIYNLSDLKKESEYLHGLGNETSNSFLPKGTVHAHNYEVELKNANLKNSAKNNKVNEYFNYFLGQNKNTWANEIKGFGDLYFESIYSKIDLNLYSSDKNLKYDFIVKPGGNVNEIELIYKYTAGILLENKHLKIMTSAGNVIEETPYAYQNINGKKVEVQCQYKITSGNHLGFDFPKGYNKEYALIIDPTVIVCSYSNHTGMSFGCAAGYDDIGNIYSASCARVGYPVTTGAFQQTYMGNFDIVLSAYNPNGTSKLFSTYIGGDSLEYITVVKVLNNEIILGGTSTSWNYPCSATAYDTTLNGQSDMVFTKINMTGTALIASTFIGGAREESSWGANALGASAWDSNRNLDFMPDTAGNIYVSAVTNSTNFPVTSGAISSMLNGTGTGSRKDALVFKLNNTLSSLVWSTYLGGTSDECGKAIKLDGSGGVYCLGVTTSTNFPTTPGAISNTKPGPIPFSDMFVTHINSSGTAIIASTYIGTTAADYGSYMDIDLNNDIHICGHIVNPSALVSTPGLYSDVNGYNTLYKVNSSLSSVIYKTKFGYPPPAGGPTVMVPYVLYSAFRVDSCQNIYLAGFADNLLPTTSNKLQSFAGGITDAYIAVFGSGCTSLKFASYFGGPVTHYSIGEHCDYSSSQFDNKGHLYLSICSDGGLPTTPSAFTPTFTSSGDSIYNDAFLKIDLQTFINANSSYGSTITGCPPFTPTFVSTTNLGSTYWNLGNGVTSTKDTVSTTYTNLGTYNVLLVITDTSTCNKYDSIKSLLNVINPTNFDLGEDIPTCLNTKVLIYSNVSAVTYSWSSGQTWPNIYALPGTYTLTINNGGCNSSDVINVIVAEKKLSERFPNVVTANGDNVNDFIDLSKYNFEEVDLTIYDRWGREVERITDVTAKWNPDNLTAGTYFYVANYKSICIGKYATDKGFVTLIK